MTTLENSSIKINLIKNFPSKIKFLFAAKVIYLDLLILFAGILLPFAFAPFNFFFLAIISPTILLYCWLTTSAKRAYWYGFLFGLGQFGLGVSWVYVSIHTYGNAPMPLAALFTLIFAATLAQFPAWIGYLFVKLFPKPNLSKIFAFPCIFVMMEWIRSWIFTGFPWLLLCYSQTNSPLRGYIPVIGDHGVTFLLTLTSSILLLFFLGGRYHSHSYGHPELSEGSPSSRQRLRRWRSFAPLRMTVIILSMVLIWVGGFCLTHVAWNKKLGPSIQVSLIQGNIPQESKWDEDRVKSILDSYVNLTKPNWKSSLIIWPEAAITLPMPYAKEFVDYIDQQAKHHHASLIVGIPIRSNNPNYFYNGILSLGNGEGAYYKRHLVPFGEYVPFETWLRGLLTFFDLPMSYMIKGPVKQSLLKADNFYLASFVCYEIAYAQDLYAALPKANLLVTLSNDTWFGDSLAPAQHLQIAQYRAIQGARELLFSTNNGITAIVDSQGLIKKQIPQFQTAVLTGDVQPMIGTTPWSKVGDTPFIIAILFTLVLLLKRQSK